MAQKDCPQCDGTGWKPVEVNGIRRVTPCDCQNLERSALLLKEARIPPRYEHCELSNFDVRKNMDSGQANPSLSGAKICAGKFVEEYPTDFGLLFVGPTGVGKTHLAVAVLRELMLRKGVECLFYDFHELLKTIRDSYNPGTQSTELSVLQPVLDAEVLLLDELAASNPSGWVKETLQHIINSRYNYKKVTLITTTLPFGDASGRREGRQISGEPFPDVEFTLNQLGITLRSRLYEMCKLVEMSSDDYRKAIKQAGYKFHPE
ncbi:MAG: ATP-binding protein [Terriglobia bacterium]